MVGCGHVLRFGLDDRARPSEPALEVRAGAGVEHPRLPDSTSIAPLSPVTETVMSFGLPWSSHVTRTTPENCIACGAARISRDEARAFGGRRVGAGGVQRADEAEPRERHDAHDNDEPTSHRRPASGPIGTSELIESPTSEVAAPCCVATAVTFGRTAVRPGTTTTAMTAAATAAAPAIQPARDFRFRRGSMATTGGGFGVGVGARRRPLPRSRRPCPRSRPAPRVAAARARRRARR